MSKSKLFLVLLVAMFFTGCAEIIDPGDRGVRVTMGKPGNESLPEGMYFYMPFFSTVIEMNTKIKKFVVETDAYTKDVQQVKVAATINYYPDRNKIHELFRNVGKNWDEVLMPQIVQGNLKNVVGRHEAVSIIENRGTATSEVETAIKEAAAIRDIIVTKVEITDLEFTKEFEAAVEAKVTAIQRAKEAENKTVQITQEANQQLITAKAAAESMRIRANALTQNKNLVEYEAVQKWDGHMPTYMMGQALPFINIGK